MSRARLALCAIAAASFGAVAALGCTDGAQHRLEWRLAFAEPALAIEAVHVTGEIYRGTCASLGERVHRTLVTPTASMTATPPSLDRGTFAFVAWATDATCTRIASGCADATLPSGDSFVVTSLQRVDRVAECAGAMCVAGVCAESDAGVADGGTSDAGSCGSGDSCTSGVLRRCAGGSEVVETCALGCSSEGTRCAELVPSNVDPSLMMPAPNGSVPAGTTVRFSTDTCTQPELATYRVAQGAGLPELCVLVVGDLTIEAGGTLVLRGDRSFVVLAYGNVAIEGTIDASAYGSVPGAGGFLGSSVPSRAATGVGAGGGGDADPINAGGGGGGALCGAGGEGGASESATGGPAGSPLGLGYELVPLHGGGGGGAGAFIIDGATYGRGGAGGGALQITARGSIAVNGRILAGGGGGAGGLLTADGEGAGGGGGAGGAVLLESPDVVFGTGSFVNVGGGGGGGSAGLDVDGTDGQDAALTTGRASGGRGAGDGGNGAGSASRDGANGRDGPYSGGGGGGGAGCVLVRTRDGTVGGTFTATPSIVMRTTLRVR